MSHHIAHSKARRNALCPASGLPIELVVEVAAHVLNDWTSGFSRPQKIQNLTLVCKRWHTVVDQTPSLWSFLSPHDPHKFTSTAVFKSRSSDLTISQHRYFAVDNPEAYATFMEIITPEVHRWGSVMISPTALVEHTLGHLQRPSPRLTTFALHTRSWTSKDYPQEPIDLFAGHAPRLRELDLLDVPLRWDSAALVGLTSLSVTFQKKHAPSTIAILRVLSQCPDLTKLCLRGWELPPADQASLQVELARLSELQVERLDSNMIYSLLLNIRAPVCTKLQIVCEYLSDLSIIPLPSSAEFAHSFPSIHQLLDEVENITVHDPSQTTVEVTVERDDRSGSFEFEFQGARVTRALEWLEDIIPCLKSRSTEVSFEIFDNGDWAVLDMLDRYFGVTNLSTYTDQEEDREDIESLLRYLATPNLTSRGLEWPFPSLERLDLVGPDIDPSAILKMVQGRYETEHYGEWSLPNDFTRIYVDRARSDSETRRAVENIVGKGVVVWNDD